MDPSKAPSKEKDDNMKVESGPGSNTEGDDQRKTYGATRGQETEYVALRTVPVIVKNGNKRIPVNCLLDEGSDTSYINEDVIEALGLHGAKTEINVKVANDETVTFMSSTFDVGLESTDGRVDTTITVQSSKKICGGMKPVNWIKIKHNWQHLQKIYFPKLVTGRRVDILLGADHHELMYSMKEVVGEHGQPSARLCPLGWTAVGKVNERHADELPLAAEAVGKNCYMDDLMPSVESSSQAIETRQQLTTLGDKAKFHIPSIGEIHEETNPVQWKYVPTSSNPADHGTRGLTVTELKENELWWNRPEFLKESRDKWPEEKFAEQNAQVFAEMKPERKGDAVCFNATQEDEREEEWHLKPSRFSKWYRLSLTKRLELGLSLVRVRAWVHRFIANCRKLKKDRVSGELTANELQGVEEIIIREAQMEVYCQEITALKEKKSLPKRSSILNLTPIWKDGLLRSNTRLRYSEDLSEEIKYPIILSKRHPVTKLIVKYHHESEGHRMGDVSINDKFQPLVKKYPNGIEIGSQSSAYAATDSRKCRV
ncbi:Hypothetical predicted protein [Paramuricea clavata]|uniref:Uncharacterized protein n=1 Tax=Paramuricea clavata TaxID=317549 RepID=A0A7D9HUR9_PARCT|nr:Hypothetical predicted protein [Paramuricea clavata]